MTHDDTEPAALDLPRRRGRLFSFVPDVSMGTLIQIGVLVVGAVSFYGQYAADRARDHAEVAQIKIDADSQRTAVKESLTDLKGDVKEIQSTLGKVNESLAVLKARSDLKGQ